MDIVSQLTARQKFILNVIFKKNSLDINEISRQFDISGRTITREINVINKILKSNGVSIYENNSNLSIMGKKEKIHCLWQSLDGIPPQWLLNQEQRLILITSQLLLSDEHYKLAFFSYQLNVSEGTISLYMDKIKRWLRVRYLTLIRKRGSGVSVDGAEWIKRNSIVELIYELKPIDELCLYVYGNKDDKIIETFFKILFGKRLFSVSKKLVMMFEKNVSKVDDTTYLSSLIHVLISLKKTELKNPIILPQYLIKDVILSGRFDFISSMKEYLESIDIILTDSELTYIVIHLFGCRYIYERNGQFKEFGVSFEDISRELLYEVEKRLNIKINCDSQLIAGLSQHINSALYRINMDMPVKNTILDEIKEYYKDIFRVVSYSCKIIFSKYNINMTTDEIGFITMHIGAAIERYNRSNNKFSVLIICPNGIGTAKILSSKLKMVIHNIKYVEICSFKEWKEEHKKYDIVLSTTNIDLKDKKSDESVVVVSPFLKKDDIDKINECIVKLNKNKNIFNRDVIDSHESAVANLSQNESVSLNKQDMIDKLVNDICIEYVDTHLFNELIKIIVEKVYEKRIIASGKEIERLIIAREKLGNVVIPNSHIGLLHTRSDYVITPSIQVYRLNESIKLRSIGFDYEDVDTFIVLLARKKEKPYILEQMGKVSMSLIENRKLFKILRNADIKKLRIEVGKILYREDI